MWCGNRCDGGQESVKKPRTVVRAQRPSGHGSYSSGKMWASGEELENMCWQLDLLFSTFICVWSFTNSYCFLHLIWRSCNFFVLQCFGRVVGRVKMWVLLGRRRVSCTGDFLECRLHTMAAHHAAATHRVWCTKSCLVYSRISCQCMPQFYDTLVPRKFILTYVSGFWHVTLLAESAKLYSCFPFEGLNCPSPCFLISCVLGTQ